MFSFNCLFNYYFWSIIRITFNFCCFVSSSCDMGFYKFYRYSLHTAIISHLRVLRFCHSWSIECQHFFFSYQIQSITPLKCHCNKILFNCVIDSAPFVHIPQNDTFFKIFGKRLLKKPPCKLRRRNFKFACFF